METTQKRPGEEYYHLFPTLIILALAILSVVLYFSLQAQQQKAVDAFAQARNELAQTNLSQMRGEIEDRFPTLFVDCQKRAAYDRYIDMDSRTMTITQLDEALSLHSECGTYFYDKAAVTLGFFDASVADLSARAEVLEEGGDLDTAVEVAALWQRIAALEREHNDIYGRMIEIQGEYWEAERMRATEEISARERETMIGTLNIEANQNLERLSEISNELQQVRAKEGSIFSSHFADDA